jgi:hypothetical protein
MPSTIHIQNVNTDYLSISDIQQLENNDIKQIVLFYEPTQILNIKILKDRGDTNKYIITLYTNEFVINVDSNVTISKENFEERMDKSKKSNHFYLYLRDIEFIRGTVQLETKFGVVNSITPVTDINPLEYYMDALDICDNKLNQKITQCEKQNKFYEEEMKLYRELKRTCNTQINNSSNQENQDLKQQLESKNQEIIELKKQNNKNPNDSQSTQTTIIIICVLIIILLLGLCIYLYFFKR